VTIQNNLVHDCATGIEFQYGGSAGTTYQVSNNTVYNVNWAFDTIGYAGNYDTIYFFRNHSYNLSTWDDTLHDDFHHNAIHMFQGNGSAATISHFYIYNNEFDGPVGGCCVTSQIYVDNNGTNTGFIDGYIFNNVFTWANGDCSGTCGNGQLGAFSGTWSVFNNTFLGNATGTTPQGSEMAGNQVGVSLTVKNNLMTLGQGEAWFGNGASTFTAGNLADNLYADSPSSSQVFQCGGNFYGMAQFASYQSCIANEANSKTTSSQAIPSCTSNTDCSNLMPVAGSPAIGAGTNLTSLCAGQPVPGLGALCSDKVGNARPASGAWDVGAYEYCAGSGCMHSVVDAGGGGSDGSGEKDGSAGTDASTPVGDGGGPLPGPNEDASIPGSDAAGSSPANGAAPAGANRGCGCRETAAAPMPVASLIGPAFALLGLASRRRRARRTRP
jgi:hypothetical protein